jgi:ethanolaminephosphotransferase
MGLLFDHGCDAFTMGLVTIIFMKLVSCGNNALALTIVATTMTSFHLATLEEYYLGTLVLPMCNGVSDGSISVIGAFLLSGIFGTDFWTIGVGYGWLTVG